MYIKCLFIERTKHGGPELFLTWDEYTIDENPEGFIEACDKKIAALKGEFIHHQIITLCIADHDLENAFHPPAVDVEVLDE